MALKFQYNKTALQELNKQLKIRIRALPTLKNKESALRMEVKRARDHAHALDLQIQEQYQKLERILRLYGEFDQSIISVKDVQIVTRKIAGVKIPVLEKVEYELKDFNLFNAPTWYPDGIHILKQIGSLQIERVFFIRKMRILDAVRKKTTQKVNLYEKVQIPAFEEGILKIKRFMEDEDNLSKASQKILKNRMQSESTA